MTQGERQFRFQEQFGQVISEGDFVIFQILLDNPQTIVSDCLI